MCGLIGFVDSISPEQLWRGLHMLHHRGPDASSCWFGDVPEGRRIGLGHARLSILDLSAAANQPFVSDCGRYHIVFNGEIYNHAAIRTQLQKEGIQFRTRSDTEVLLAGYMQWGEALLKILDGMFAFVVYDTLQSSLFFARDHFGIKPFYFRHDQPNRTFHFASEARPLALISGVPLAADSKQFAMFLMNGWLYEPQTGFVGISKLAPGQYGTFDVASGELALTTYYDPLHATSTASLQELLNDAVQLQACADVPVGIFFSGGMDSAVVAAAYPHKLSGLFIDHGQDSGDLGLDRTYAAGIAARLQMHLKVLRHTPDMESADQIISEFRAVAAGTEEPISDFTYVAARQLANLARQSGFKVMLSGMGGDELFGGYPRMRFMRYQHLIRPFRSFYGAADILLRARASFSKRIDRLRSAVSSDSFIEAYTALVGYFSLADVQKLLGHGASSDWLQQISERLSPAAHLSPLKKAMYLDRYGFLPHNLTVTDRASMAESIEVRVPLLTPGLAAWSFQQPDRHLIDLRYTKKPLREFAIKRLGRSMIDRPKQGFNPPLDGKINKLGRGRIRSELHSGRLQAVVNLNFVDQLIDRHFAGTSNETYRLWQLLYFNYWLDACRR